MRYLKGICICLLSFFTLTCFATLSKDDIHRHLKNVFPESFSFDNLQIQEQKDGLIQINIGTKVFYMTEDGQYFIDPGSEKARNYVINIAKEACELGFDEIQFDYIRYPDSNYKYMVFKDENNYDNRIKNINSFLMVAKKEINSIYD